jgi:dihydropteroate synthase
LLGKLSAVARLGFPVLVGTSRKGFIGKALELDGRALTADTKLWGTAAAVAASTLNGAHIVRVHDVAEMVCVARVADCVLDSRVVLRK